MKYFIFLVGILLISTYSLAQDIIYKADGSEIKAKIIEITTNKIKYKIFAQLEDTIMDIPISQVFMIIYEGGEKEVFKKEEEQQFDINIQSDIKISEIAKDNLSIEIIDNRDNKVLIGKEPDRIALGLSLISIPIVTVNDNEGKLYSYAEKTLRNILIKNDFKNSNNPNGKLEIRINELFEKVTAGIYGTNIQVTQICKATVSVIDNNKIIFSKDFNSFYVAKANEYKSQFNMLNEQYSETLDKKARNKELRQNLKDYSVNGYFIAFIVVFDDIIHQLLNDRDFQNIF